MIKIHKVRQSGIARDFAVSLLLRQAPPYVQVSGKLGVLPIYLGSGSKSPDKIAGMAERVGWRFLFLPHDPEKQTGAIVDFRKTRGNRPVLTSYADCNLAQEITHRLSLLEIENAESDAAYRPRLLIVADITCEFIWLKAVSPSEKDIFDRLSKMLDGSI